MMLETRRNLSDREFQDLLKLVSSTLVDSSTVVDDTIRFVEGYEDMITGNHITF
jgi:hypothetical protein